MQCATCATEFEPQRYREGRNRFCSRECNERERRASGRQRTASLRSYYKRRYGLTELEVATLRKLAVCGICGTDEPQGRHGNFQIDHDHVTGEVRGVLCHNCNLMIGHAQDDPDILRAAIAYLEGDLTP
jgi:hypothetical protein